MELDIKSLTTSLLTIVSLTVQSQIKIEKDRNAVQFANTITAADAKEYLTILASDEYSVSKDSHLVVVTAGAAQQKGESRLDLVERNVSIMQNIIPKVLAYSPNAAICIVANPCDILTAVASKIAGPTLPAGRIFGSCRSTSSAAGRTPPSWAL